MFAIPSTIPCDKINTVFLKPAYPLQSSSKCLFIKDLEKTGFDFAYPAMVETIEHKMVLFHISR